MADGQDEKKDLEKAYGAVLVTRARRKLDIKSEINTTATEVQDAFHKAATGEDAINSHLASTMVGRQTTVYRPDQTDTNTYDFSRSAQSLLFLVDKKIADGRLNDEDLTKYNERIDKLAADSGLDGDHVWALTREYEQQARALDNKLAGDFNAGFHVAPALEREIGTMLVKRARGGELTATEQKKLDRDLEKFGRLDKISKDALAMTVTAFETHARDETLAKRQDYINTINSDIANAKTGSGAQFSVKAPEEHMAVPKDNSTTDAHKFGAWDVFPDDPPKRLPPLSPELGDFLIALHEAEHTKREGDPIAPRGYSDESVTQAGEIDADNAIVKFMNDAHEPQAKEYWLQSREVRSFMDGIRYNDLTHDTATFLRVYEKTGQQIDLDAFDMQKRELLAKIKDKVDMSDPGKLKIADIMGAAGDLLAEDARQTDPAKKLSAVQKAEAKSLIRDAQAMGYDANPNYPRPRPASGGPGKLPDERFAPIAPPAPPPAPGA